MSARIHVGAGERGRVWVFAVDLDREGLAAFTRRNGDWPPRAALGAGALDPDHVEVIAVSDLEGVGLSLYLEEGYGIAPEELDGLRAWLDAERGAVMVLSARALGGAAQTLSPRAPLRLLASLSEERPRVSFAPLPSEAAAGTVAPTGAGSVPHTGQGRLGALILAAAVALALLALAVVS